MPEMSGDELAGAIKARAPEVPILLISGDQGAPENNERFAGIFAEAVHNN
jgi:CheY-like chemotaxis protein